MLKLYGAHWCSHCMQTAEYLEKNDIEFQFLDIEKQPGHIVSKIVDVNGGEEWVIPTLEYNGHWREGKEFNEKDLEADLRKMGVI